MLQDDLTIDSLRATRHEISAACQHDPTTLIAYYLELQQQYQQRLLKDDAALSAETSLPARTEKVNRPQVIGS